MSRKPKSKADIDNLTERDIPLDIIDEPDIPARNTIEERKVHDLAQSMKATGQLQAIALKPRGDRYEIIYGHRRFLAARALGKATIRARICDVDDADLWAMRIAENDDRLDTTPLEQAHAYKQLQTHGNYTQAILAKRLGKSEAYVSQRLAILSYPPMLQAALGTGDITFSVARILCKITDSMLLKSYLSYAIDNGITPAVAERWVSEIRTTVDDDGREHQHMPESFDPEQMAPPSAKCHWCDTERPYSQMQSIWQCRTCAKNVIEALLQIAEGTE